MLALRLAPAVVALVVLGAHFLRADAWLPLAVVASLLALLALRRRYVPWLLQAGLVLGALEWLRTLAGLVAMRQSLGVAWGRMAAILGAVAAVTLLAALLLRARRVRAHYDRAFAASQTATGATRPGTAG